MEGTRNAIDGSLSFGDAGASSSMTKPSVRFSSANSTLTRAGNRTDKVVENPIAFPTVKNPIDGSGGTDGAGDGEGKATPPVAMLDLKRFNRIMRNRIHAQRSRMKKMAYISDLENRAKILQTKIDAFKQQIAAYKNKQQSLQFEQSTLKLKIAASEKERLLQEVETEKSRAELSKLQLLQKKQEELSLAQRMMPNPSAVLGGVVIKSEKHEDATHYSSTANSS